MAGRNPFEVLRLDPSAGEEEIVRQAGKLRQRETDEARLAEIRQAVSALTSRPEERQLLALLTHPRTEYYSPILNRLAAAFRRPPSLDGTKTACSELDPAEFRDLILAQADNELQLVDTVFEPVPAADDSVEIARQLMEAIWQSLVWDVRA